MQTDKVTQRYILSHSNQPCVPCLAAKEDQTDQTRPYKSVERKNRFLSENVWAFGGWQEYCCFGVPTKYFGQHRGISSHSDCV